MTQAFPFFVVMAVLGEIAMAGLIAAARNLRVNGGRSRAVYGAIGLSAILWVPLASYFLQGHVMLNPAYILCLAAWVAVNCGVAFGSRFLTGLQGASEATAYRFALSVVLAVILDVTVFHVSLTPALWAIIAVLTVGGILLHTPAKTGFEAAKGSKTVVPLKLKAGVIVLSSVLDVSAFALFKYAAQTQPDIFVHNAIFQAVLGVAFLVGGGRAMVNDVQKKYIPSVFAVLIAVLAIMASSASAYAIAGLPLSLFIMFSLIRGLVAKARDATDMPAKPNLAFILSFLLIATGLIGISVLSAQ